MSLCAPHIPCANFRSGCCILLENKPANISYSENTAHKHANLFFGVHGQTKKEGNSFALEDTLTRPHIWNCRTNPPPAPPLQESKTMHCCSSVCGPPRVRSGPVRQNPPRTPISMSVVQAPPPAPPCHPGGASALPRTSPGPTRWYDFVF